MKTITVRNLPPELEKRVEEEARARGASYNMTVIRLLEERLGLAHERSEASPIVHHDLDHLVGAWDEEEGLAFEEGLVAARSIDSELWDEE